MGRLTMAILVISFFIKFTLANAYSGSENSSVSFNFHHISFSTTMKPFINISLKIFGYSSIIPDS